MIDIPLTVGVGAAAVTALAAPVLAALGAIAALVTECTIEVEKIGDTLEGKGKSNRKLATLYVLARGWKRCRA